MRTSICSSKGSFKFIAWKVPVEFTGKLFSFLSCYVSCTNITSVASRISYDVISVRERRKLNKKV